MSPPVPVCTRVSAGMNPPLGPPRFVREHVGAKPQIGRFGQFKAPKVCEEADGGAGRRRAHLGVDGLYASSPNTR